MNDDIRIRVCSTLQRPYLVWSWGVWIIERTPEAVGLFFLASLVWVPILSVASLIGMGLGAAIGVDIIYAASKIVFLVLTAMVTMVVSPVVTLLLLGASMWLIPFTFIEVIAPRGSVLSMPGVKLIPTGTEDYEPVSRKYYYVRNKQTLAELRLHYG